MIRRVRAYLGGPGGVPYALLTRAAQGLSGPVTAALVIRHFEPATQGYHYTFLSLLALQTFAELGLSQVITTFAAHEWSKLSLSPVGRIEGDDKAFARLSDLARKGFRWYGAGAIVVLILIGSAGWFVLDGAAPSASAPQWHLPWLALCAATATAFLLLPVWALLAGCGQMAALNRFRLRETIARSLVLWLAIILGAGLWSAAVATTASLVCGAAFLAIRYRPFLAGLMRRHPDVGIPWRQEILPMQWRIALSWASGYFAFYLFTPVTFRVLGPEAAGRMGLTWSLASAVSTLAGTWTQVRAPSFADLVAKRQFGALDRLASTTARIGVSTSGILGLVAIAGLWGLTSLWPAIGARFLPVSILAMFLAADLLHQLSMVQSTYLRAFRREPFLPVSILFGLAVGSGTLALTGPLGLAGPAFSYLVGMGLVIALGTWIFIRRRQEWTR